jgi:hypothetical protein
MVPFTAHSKSIGFAGQALSLRKTAPGLAQMNMCDYLRKLYFLKEAEEAWI